MHSLLQRIKPVLLFLEYMISYNWRLGQIKVTERGNYTNYIFNNTRQYTIHKSGILLEANLLSRRVCTIVNKRPIRMSRF